jgi:hypothetical protein
MDPIQTIPPITNSQQQPLLNSANLTPQQKMAYALMQSQQAQGLMGGQGFDQHGAYSPANGASTLFSGYLKGQMLSKLLNQGNAGGTVAPVGTYDPSSPGYVAPGALNFMGPTQPQGD